MEFDEILVEVRLDVGVDGAVNAAVTIGRGGFETSVRCTTPSENRREIVELLFGV
jgi:hypothetical protein